MQTLLVEGNSTKMIKCPKISYIKDSFNQEIHYVQDHVQDFMFIPSY